MRIQTGFGDGKSIKHLFLLSNRNKRLIPLDFQLLKSILEYPIKHFTRDIIYFYSYRDRE